MRVYFFAAVIALAQSANAEVVRTTPEQQERFATLINLNGQLCAKVIEVRKRDNSAYYVVCETHRDSLQQKAYAVDLKTGKVR